MYKTNRLFFLFIMIFTILAWPTSQASAMFVKCRVDPHFMLSNGDMVTVTLDVSTDVANIKSIHYILHVPAGVTVTGVVYTAQTDRRAITETYAVYQDSPVRTYTTDTIVTTRTGRVAVTVYTRLNGLPERSISGYSGQHLVTTVSNR
jgi:hypothetical protein